MNKLPVYVSESDFETYILPNLTHKPGHNRLKVSYHYIFNLILYVLKSGDSWRALRLDNQIVTWQNIYYHYAEWCVDGSFTKLFEGSTVAIWHKLVLECLQLDDSLRPSKKGTKTSSGKEVKESKR
jgi:transposase